MSYYLPALHKLHKDSLAYTVDEIHKALSAFPSLGISSTYLDYPLLKRYFPDKPKRLWWAGSKKSFWNWRNKLRLYRMMSDETVKVLLVPFE